ncbi:hypothetical protein C4D60_Mb08t13320 [Musa balbisiana]|uniref:Uncharacterized protein n=1 Tax=Musa balbisiana TaxID=52838 RepID=A0A4S8K3I0_MUSBA|nr:hypothetical protein C4D60_Mb08t13320 [Musa balbisiana]
MTKKLFECFKMNKKVHGFPPNKSMYPRVRRSNIRSSKKRRQKEGGEPGRSNGGRRGIPSGPDPVHESLPQDSSDYHSGCHTKNR